jgi:two-component sensor histidine kinase
MARLHRRLHAGDADITLDSRRFILDLCEDIRNSMARDLSLSIECNAASVALPLAQAVPLGLIVNELVTNTIKYAFPKGGTGEVRVNFEENAGRLYLTVQDNGVGIQSLVHGSGLGLHLVKQLSMQLDGRLELIPTDKGSTFRLAIPSTRKASSRAFSRPAASTLH